MADVQYQEGQILTNPETGDQIILQNVNGQLQWVPHVSTGTDIKHGLEKGAETVGATIAGAPAGLGNMTARGINAAGNEAFADWPQSAPGRAVQWLQNQTDPYTPAANIKNFEQRFGPVQSPVNPAGKITEATVEAAPFGVLGPEALAPNMVRAALSGAVSEGAGELMQGTPYEIPARLGAGIGTYGVSGAMMPGRIVNTPRGVMADTLRGAGVPVSAADATGSRLMATLEGRPPSGQNVAASAAVQRMGGVPLQPGDTRMFSERLMARRAQLQDAVQGLEQNTAITPSIQLSMQLRNSALRALQGAPSPGDRDAIIGALNEYNARAGMVNPQTGVGSISGQTYNQMRQRWNSSGIPALREMAGHLDNAMDAATANGPYAGMWNQWRQNWANYEGLQAVSDSMMGAATTQPLNMDPIVSGMHMKTPMRDVAESAQGILGNRPPPYQPDVNSAAALAGLASGAAGYEGGGGVEPGVYGFLMGGAAPYAAKVVAAPIQAVMRSAPGQRAMLNMDPKVAAALLANQGIALKQRGDAAQPPQQPAQ